MAKERDLLRKTVERISTTLKRTREEAQRIVREREERLAAYPKVPKRRV